MLCSYYRYNKSQTEASKGSPSEDSTFDDSDKDPDYEPIYESDQIGKRKIPQYFSDKDLHYNQEMQLHSIPNTRLESTRMKLIDYTDSAQIFPSAEVWETKGSTPADMRIAVSDQQSPCFSFGVQNVDLQNTDDNMMPIEVIENYCCSSQNGIDRLSPALQPSTSGAQISILENTDEISDTLCATDSDISLLDPQEQLSQDTCPNKGDICTAERETSMKKRKVNAPILTLLPPCPVTCRKKCFEQFTPDQRELIFDYFKNLDYGERQMFLDKYIVKKDVKYRKVDAEINKQFSISYNLPKVTSPDNLNTTSLTDQIPKNPEQKEISTNSGATQRNNIDLNKNIPANMLSVCKTMFIHTIGFKSDSVITNFLRRTINDLPCLEDRRGKKRGAQMKQVSENNYQKIKQHIDSYHPQVSHYNIAHAPHRKYLPSDLTVHQLHKDFKSKGNQLSYETYRKVFEKENIGFSAPTQDDCSVCSVYKHHTHTDGDPDSSSPISSANESVENYRSDEKQNKENVSCNILPNNEFHCSICENHKIHKQRYTIARQKYMQDTSNKWNDEYEIYAVDMQKILILPKMTIKNSFFVSRLVVFHETFANLKPGCKNKCVLWHEAIMGRNGPDVVSAYYNTLIRLNDSTKHIIFWVDNCTAQNKNWVLFTACTIFVNQNWGPESITFKYFEPGHSFMKADSIHGQIGKKWNKTPEVLDFEDLEKLIRSSNRLNDIISLRAEDFKLFENGFIQRKKGSSFPKLCDIKSVQFRKGSKKLFYKLELEDEIFLEVSMLKPKFKIELPQSLHFDRGINSTKKQTILKELVPHMPPRKQIFWTNLPSSDEQEDLGKTLAQI